MAVKSMSTTGRGDPGKGPKTNEITIPKSARSARLRKWEKFDAPGEALETHTWLNLDAVASSDGRPPRIGIGPRPGTHTVCYYDETSGQYDDCHVIPD